MLLTAEVRSALVERLTAGPGPTWPIRYWRTKSDYTEPGSADVQRVSFHKTVRLCCSADLRVIEVPEPLYIRYWPQTAALLAFARTWRRVTRRPRLLAATYAIENLEPQSRLKLPSRLRARCLDRAISPLLETLVRKSARRYLDAVAFGSAAAERNYLEVLGLSADGLAVTRFPEEFMRCRLCFDPAEPRAVAPLSGRRRRVLFAGELSERKGLDLLIRAWEASSLGQQGWTLLICGEGPLEPLVREMSETDPSLEWNTPDRAALHNLYCESRVVVLPSRRVDGWREQAGLSLLEGEAHGCALIVSSESGIADDLRLRANARVVQGGSLESLTEALRDIESLTAATPGDVDSRVRVQEWFEKVTRDAS